MAQYRCAVCGSPNVQRIDRNDGFSYKKALVGTAVFGNVGAVAGINGKQSTQYVCPDCGSTVPEPMDRIKKDLIDTVMTAPETLAPRLYPNIYFDYPHLKKEKQAALDSEISQMLSTPMDSSNPLGLTEMDFRNAVSQFDEFSEHLYKNTSNGDLCNQLNLKKTYEELAKQPWDMRIMVNGLKAAEIIAMTGQLYPHLIPGKDTIPNVYRVDGVCYVAAICYILITHGSFESNDALCAFVQKNNVYHQLFSVIMRDRMQMTARNVKRSYENDPAFSVKKQKQMIWDQTWNTMGSWLDISYRMFSRKVFGFSTTMDTKKVSFPFRIINDSLYVANEISLEEVLASEAPELLNNISECQDGMNKIKKEIDTLRHSEPSHDEVACQKKKDSLKGEKDNLLASIDKLEKKIFGKKKAQQEIQSMRKEIAELDDEIHNQQMLIERLKNTREADAQNAIQNKQAEMDNLRIRLNDLQKQKVEYIQQIPKWICIAGPDLND